MELTVRTDGPRTESALAERMQAGFDTIIADLRRLGDLMENLPPEAVRLWKKTRGAERYRRRYARGKR